MIDWGNVNAIRCSTSFSTAQIRASVSQSNSLVSVVHDFVAFLHSSRFLHRLVVVYAMLETGTFVPRSSSFTLAKPSLP